MSRGHFSRQGTTAPSLETQQLRIHLLQVQNRIQMLQQYRQQQRPVNHQETTNANQHFTSHTASYQSQQYQHINRVPSHPYGMAPNNGMPTTTLKQHGRHPRNQWPVEEHTYCELDSTDSSLCWSSYLMPIDRCQQSRQESGQPRSDSSLDLSAINEMSLDDLHTLEQSLETSLTEISSILPDEESNIRLSSFRKDEKQAKMHPRNSTPNLHHSFPQTLSLYQSSNAVNAMRPPTNYQQVSNGQGAQRRNTISHPSSSSYRQAQRQRIISVQQPVSSGEYSEYIQRLAFEGDSTNDSSVLDSTFTSYQRGDLLNTNAPRTNRQRPACIGQESSLSNLQNLSTFTHSNDSHVQLEDPGSDPSEPDIASRAPSGDSDPDVPDVTIDSDATCFMENPMCVRPVTHRQKQSRYKTVTNRLRKVSQQIKSKGPKTVNLKTLAVL